MLARFPLPYSQPPGRRPLEPLAADTSTTREPGLGPLHKSAQRNTTNPVIGLSGVEIQRQIFDLTDNKVEATHKQGNRSPETAIKDFTSSDWEDIDRSEEVEPRLTTSSSELTRMI